MKKTCKTCVHQFLPGVCEMENGCKDKEHYERDTKHKDVIREIAEKHGLIATTNKRFGVYFTDNELYKFCEELRNG